MKWPGKVDLPAFEVIVVRIRVNGIWDCDGRRMVDPLGTKLATDGSGEMVMTYHCSTA